MATRYTVTGNVADLLGDVAPLAAKLVARPSHEFVDLSGDGTLTVGEVPIPIAPDGSFSVALAAGLRRNPTAHQRLAAGERVIHAYDLFDWHPNFDSWVAGTVHAGKYKLGDDFREAFRIEASVLDGRLNIRPGFCRCVDAQCAGGQVKRQAAGVGECL